MCLSRIALCFIRATSLLSVRHCEERSDEAIHIANPYCVCGAMDCFAPLAMTISLNKNKRIILNVAPARQLLRPREHRADRRIARPGENTGPAVVDASQERSSR